MSRRSDFAGAAPSASAKLIYGGLRYLEYREFRSSRDALAEREVLLQAAPHIVWPLRFVLPHSVRQRPWPIMRLGLFLYDHLGGRRTLLPIRSMDLWRNSAGAPLQPGFTRGLEYSDHRVEDARPVVPNARNADGGATVLTRTRCATVRRGGGLWQATLRDEPDGRPRRIAARAVVNAADPWAAQVLGGVAGLGATDRVRPFKGSHIVTRRLYPHDRCYIFQNEGRICFAIPYDGDFLLIVPGGDFPWTGAPALAAAMLGDARSMVDLGEAFGSGVTAREVDRQVREEWACEPADLLWQRSKRGLRIGAAGQAALAAHTSRVARRRAAE